MVTSHFPPSKALFPFEMMISIPVGGHLLVPSLQVLSVIAQQIMTILQAVSSTMDTFLFEGTTLRIGAPNPNPKLKIIRAYHITHHPDPDPDPDPANII